MDYSEYSLINYVIPLIGFFIAFIAQIYMNGTYNKYKIQGLKKHIEGKDVARQILDSNGLSNIKVLPIKGNLTDHYDPKKKTISLSYDIYNGDTIAAASVAAHECGHAIQDKNGYFFLKLRNTIVPFVNFSTKIGYGVILIGIIFGFPKIAIIGLILLLAMLFFQLITLPVEFNASTRARKELINLNIISNSELSDTKSMLNAAALTYVASLITTLLQIIRLALK